MKKVVIIGAGVSGLVCAIESKTKNNEVILLEKEDEVGKKILASGSGKCNYYNEDISLDKYHSSYNNIEEYLNIDELIKIKDFYSNLGIIPYIRNGYYYPITKDSKTIRNALYDECISKNIKIITNFKVEEIKKNNDKYQVIGNEMIEADFLVVAAGSSAYYKENNSYDLLRKLNLKIEKPLPSLVQLHTKKYDYLKDWSGVRSEVDVHLYENNKYIKSESGEIQLTSFGISGICVYNLTPYITRGLNNNKNEIVEIDFVKNLTHKELDSYLQKYNDLTKSLEKLINNKLAKIILKILNVEETNYLNLKSSYKDKLLNLLKKFRVEIKATNDYSNAQVCAGGLSLEEISTSFEVKKYNNLFVTGELLDIDGDCGGYNITFCTYSGIKVGNNIKRRCNND